MRTTTGIHRTRTIGVPTVLAGALTATLGAVPAHAAGASPAAAHGIDEHHLAGTQNLHAAAGADIVHHAKKVPASHTVKAGETVFSIAEKYGTSVSAIVSANNLKNARVIYPGQKLKIAQHAAPAKKSHSSSSSYTVRAGDTVFRIAQAHGTTVKKILRANGLSGSAIIYPGQKLRLSGTSSASSHTSAAHHTKAHKSGASYTVRSGDSVFSIAQRHGTSVSAILEANGLGSSAIIYPGQKLRLQGTSPSTASAGHTQKVAGLDKAQRKNARLIIRIGREKGVPDRGIQIALATAMVESSLRNLGHGDRDSAGLFQQRPSQGWGSFSQITDAERSIRVFYGGSGDPNGSRTRGLLDVSNWQHRGFSEAAQAVQISAYPERYGHWEKQAARWLSQLG